MKSQVVKENNSWLCLWEQKEETQENTCVRTPPVKGERGKGGERERNGEREEEGEGGRTTLLILHKYSLTIVNSDIRDSLLRILSEVGWLIGGYGSGNNLIHFILCFWSSCADTYHHWFFKVFILSLLSIMPDLLCLPKLFSDTHIYIYILTFHFPSEVCIGMSVYIFKNIVYIDFSNICK